MKIKNIAATYSGNDKKLGELSDSKSGSSAVYVPLNINKHHIETFKMDSSGSHNDKRCDWLLLNLTKRRAYFIELKGKYLEQAYEQMLETIVALQDELHNAKINKFCARVSCSSPPVKSRTARTLFRLQEKCSGDVKHNLSPFKEDVSKTPK